MSHYARYPTFMVLVTTPFTSRYHPWIVSPTYPDQCLKCRRFQTLALWYGSRRVNVLTSILGKKVIRGGWGQRHSLDGSKLFKRLTGVWLPNQYIYIYAPRDDEEVETVMQIVKASVTYMTGSNDVK